MAEDLPYQSLYRRFRPSTFAEVRGQDHVVLALRNAVRDGRVAHAYLFSGPRGTGKTSTARILAKALNCTAVHDGEPCGVCGSCVEVAKGASLDVHELDAASNNGVDAMRDLVSRAALGTPGRQKVYIVDEVHMLSTAASNALLKTLEEPPAHVIFVLATTDPQKVLPTIRSRTQQFEFRLLGAETLVELLTQVRTDARLDVPDEALDIAVRRARGSARDALSVLDQVVASEVVSDDQPELGEIVEALAERDTGRALVAVARLMSAGFGPPQLAGDLVEYLRQGFLAMVAPALVSVAGTDRDTVAGQAERLGLATLVRAMEVLGRAQIGMRDAPDARVNLEVALVRLAHPEADESPEALLARVERLERHGTAHAVPANQAPANQAPANQAPANQAPANQAPANQAPANQAPVADPASPAGSSPATTSTPVGAGALRKTLGAVRRQAAPPAPVADPVAPPTTGPQAAPPAPVTERVPSSDEPEPFPTRNQLVQAWGDHILGRLRPKAKALFQAGRFVGVENGSAMFGLPNEIHRTRCEELRNDIEKVLSEHFGRPIGLSLVVDRGAGGADVPPAVRPGGPDAPHLPEPVESRDSGHPNAERRIAEPRIAESSNAEQGGVAPSGIEHGDIEDLAAFDESAMGEVATVDTSAEERIRRAFPGAEEVR